MSQSVDEILLSDIELKSDFIETSGDLTAISGLDNLKLALLHRLVTRPGSLIHRPNYGVGIQDFLGAVNTIDNQRAIANRIAENYARDPRVEKVTAVSINENENPELVEITVKVKVIGRENETMTFLPFSKGIQI